MPRWTTRPLNVVSLIPVANYACASRLCLRRRFSSRLLSDYHDPLRLAAGRCPVPPLLPLVVNHRYNDILCPSPGPFAATTTDEVGAGDGIDQAVIWAFRGFPTRC